MGVNKDIMILKVWTITYHTDPNGCSIGLLTLSWSLFPCCLPCYSFPCCFLCCSSLCYSLCCLPCCFLYCSSLCYFPYCSSLCYSLCCSLYCFPCYWLYCFLCYWLYCFPCYSSCCFLHCQAPCHRVGPDMGHLGLVPWAHIGHHSPPSCCQILYWTSPINVRVQRNQDMVEW